MALIPCYECEKKISDQAPACPHCAAPGVSSEKFTGWMTDYYPSGALWRREYYNEWKKLGESFSYYENGRPRWKRTFRDGEEHGPHEEYYEESGQLRSKTTYRVGELDGPHEGYYENGQLQSKRTNENGMSHGHQTVWRLRLRSRRAGALRGQRR